ncbi:MAG: DUF3857 domain-containing protein [Polyangiaceae bacterium]|nr:DUF3857 domain-containing protein [Polyangiaceae bacterium]
MTASARALRVLLCALLLVVPSAAAGEPAGPTAELAEAVARVDTARGPEGYAALRHLWSLWDHVDPTRVEAAIASASEDQRLAPPVRAYAALLGAYARVRRGDLATARRRIAALGFVDRWLVVGPFDDEGGAGLETDFGPEAELGKPLAVDRAFSGKERAVRWRRVPDAFPYGYLALGSLVRPEAKACAYAASFVRPAAASRAPRDLALWVGASGRHRVFWNGEPALTEPARRGHDADRRAARVTLPAGTSLLVVKACGEEHAPRVSVRLAELDGSPAKGLEVSNDLAWAEEAAKNAAKGGGKAAHPRAPAAAPEGPLQAFERLAAGKDPSAAELHAFADYLDATGGDDPKTHQARDLARRATEQEPSIPRLLLAASLAEDVNQARGYVEHASRLAATTPGPDVEVLLAEAELAQASPSWRASFPYYDRVLAVAPDDARALRARASLYDQAGLQRTALALLERALERNPRAVGLLGLVTTQLRALGRSTEAAEHEARYTSLRFDDETVLGNQLALAIARREREAAERWAARLLELDPDGQWSHAAAARAYRAFGQPDRARATYERALALAPEDTATLRALADLEGELGRRAEQLALLRRVLELQPQDKAAREYVEHLVPPKPRDDERHAWDSDRFLALRFAPAGGHDQRTLRDLTVTTVFENGLASRFRQVVFQPLTDAAAASARQYTFAYQADREVVQLRGVRVFRGDGRVDEAVETGETAADNPALATYTSTRVVYVQLPRLEPGDVVEIRYRVDDVTARNEYADYFGEVVYLQSSQPLLHAEYVLSLPKSRQVQVDARVPGLRRETKEAGSRRTYRFVAENVPAILPEPAMPPWAEVLGAVHVSTFADWKAMATWYWGLARDQLDLDDETRKLAREITQGANTDLEKVQAVYRWVITHTRYVALELGIHGFKPRRCVQTVARGWGDCKDKATVIVTLLKELGIPATLVIVRTQQRGDLSDRVASLAAFDHAIAYVPSLDLYLDGTAEHAGIRELPRMDFEAVGLQVNDGAGKLVRLPSHDPEADVVRRDVRASVGAGGSARLEMSVEVRGADAPDWRRRYHAEATRRERIVADLAAEHPGITLLPGAAGLSTGDLTDTERPVSLELRGTAPSFARKEGKALAMNVTPNVRLVPTYASLSERKQDVRILAFSTLADTYTIELPAGAKVVALPPAARGESPFGRYSVEVVESGRTVTVRSRVALTRTRVPPAEYAAFRRFCEEVDRAMTTRLVVQP